MIRRSIILMCICVAACSAVVAYLSMQLDNEAKALAGDDIAHTCESLLKEFPENTIGIQLTEFAPGNSIADFDYDGDQQWDDVCVPLFPPEKPKATWGYNSVLVHFKGVTNQEQLDALLAEGSLKTDYWSRRQKLPDTTHSKLAQSYENLDFSQSIILHYGYETENPVLGETSLKLSKMVGAVSLGIGFLTLLTLLFKAPPKNPDDLEDSPVTNRAGLPVS